MSDSALVVRKVHMQDPDGNDIVTLVNYGPYPCRLVSNTATPLERPEGGQLTAVTLWDAYLPAGTVVQPDDTVTINARSYEVSDETGARTDAAFTQVLLRRAA